MSKKTEPKITNCKPSDNWTSITFKPDLAKFGMETLESDVVMLMRKRVFDMAGVLGKTVKASRICCALYVFKLLVHAWQRLHHLQAMYIVLVPRSTHASSRW